MHSLHVATSVIYAQYMYFEKIQKLQDVTGKIQEFTFYRTAKNYRTSTITAGITGHATYGSAA